MNSLIAYLLAFTVVFTVSFIASKFTTSSVSSKWYQCIKPAFTPPDSVFPVVWTILYILLAISLGRTLLLPNSSNKYWLLGFYAYNLIQNIMWPFYYFDLHQVQVAMVVLVELIISTLVIISQSYRLLPAWVGHILIPYVLWLMFAATLNYASIGKQC
jgi:translocator protein